MKRFILPLTVIGSGVVITSAIKATPTIGTYRSDDDEKTVVIRNMSFLPAIIKAIEVEYQTNRYNFNWQFLPIPDTISSTYPNHYEKKIGTTTPDIDQLPQSDNTIIEIGLYEFDKPDIRLSLKYGISSTWPLSLITLKSRLNGYL